ncbi:protein-lysine methyltransferase METTL21D isoform X3 [Cryptotermes secundus]|nr:protein-lysine methyltransferase METTL21D isoform X3 [Cryptotermes secundus]XP_023713234.1 protein-lysine methyltransferase METTL21D isoform X3 [Cryptotermes secundus]XP_023713235.1 protein-lysine methyltransferase METTL21D isoform X3 [Cryptotermes secundus]
MTDLFEAMPLLQKNIDANQVVWESCGGKACTQVLQWGSDIQDWKTPDVLLLADCVYYMESVEPLVKTLCCLTDVSTEVFISQEERDTEKQRIIWKVFQEKLESHFEVTKIPEQEQHPDFCSPDIVVLRAMKRSLAN